MTTEIVLSLALDAAVARLYWWPSVAPAIGRFFIALATDGAEARLRRLNAERRAAQAAAPCSAHRGLCHCPLCREAERRLRSIQHVEVPPGVALEWARSRPSTATRREWM